ncbi:hypothetical protein EYZ11_000550 [Aspergillus tanneri]|nr:hypothetical protein EYZ11_000550 [Aspergillus tanneri]
MSIYTRRFRVFQLSKSQIQQFLDLCVGEEPFACPLPFKAESEARRAFADFARDEHIFRKKRDCMPPLRILG